MSRRSGKANKTRSDPFGAFKKTTRTAFAFLTERAYKFEQSETIIQPPECSINYLNKTTGVTVSYEWGGIPSVVLTRLNHRSTAIFQGDQIGLKFLAMERCPSSIDRFDQDVVGDLEAILTDYAQILRRCGHDILTGDFQVFPKLKRLAIEDQRNANLEMFGSETGETLEK